MFKKISVIFISITFILIIGKKTESKNVSEKAIHFYTIDGFEKPGEWQVRYSKYRSLKWNKKEEKVGDITREQDSEWYDWLVADDNKAGDDKTLPITRKKVLPNFIYKNRSVFTVNKELTEKTIFGFKARFDKAGYNFINIDPIKPKTGGDEKRYGVNRLGRYPDMMISDDSLGDQHFVNYDGGSYILLPGQTKSTGLYVWGSMYDYKLEFHIEDHAGNLHKLKAGNLKFKGWYRIGVDFPNHIQQVSYHLPRPMPLKLKRIKLVLNPEERLTGTYIYFDYLHGTADAYLESFFGEGLENSQRIWKQENLGKKK
ncbi:MAG: flagellar filament outer layer protein FlaA [Spirochaetota bacterium]|nr:flagellar filament outer layer protein FlaA [Spirochaetota bacterium]